MTHFTMAVAHPLAGPPRSAVDVSEPPLGGPWAHSTVWLTDIGLALLLVYSLPLVIYVVLSPMVLIVWTIVAIGSRVF